jgi:UDP:flavonoid glycosyltransferase YjiC (YdhE family)
MFFLAEGVPHRWLLPRMRAVVHHGGAGTTGAALRAGVPSVAVPFTADQAFWGRRIHRLQVGPAPLRADRLTVARAAAMVREAVSDHRYRIRAADLGRRLRAEDGVATAIDVIHRQLDPDHDANDT